ncbi:MAG: AAA family ATPase [Thermoguttaceae bacterium]|nr:AAA family ATPase [Thermoguttaceae bacterium]
MALTLGVGKSDFAALRRQNSYYVDKTEFLYELVQRTDNEVSLFTRPRRFGKTLMMSMTENFFSIRKDSKDLFEDLAIAKHKAFCKEWMNQYPVLFVSFKDVESLNFEGAYRMLQSKLADVYMDWIGVFNDVAIDEDDKRVFSRLKAESARDSDVKNSLKTLMRMISSVFGKRVILLIDEYDVPLARASENNSSQNEYYPKMLDVMRGIMSSALKDNEFLQFAVVTGCLRLAKESIFTGANNFVSYSVLDERFSSYFGFSENEVNELLSAAGRSDKSALVKEWYDGYLLGDSYVYCPWDVVNYVSDLISVKNAKPKNYWKNTSHNSVLLSFVKNENFSVVRKFEKLLNGGTITQTITDQLTYDSLGESENNLWSVLLMTGYLTKAVPEEDGETVSLKIPNKEISTIFEDAVVKYFTDSIDVDSIKELMNSFWETDEVRASEILSALLRNTISYNDYHENYYHAFLAGVFVGRGYGVESNKERGLGRPDILLMDDKNARAIVIETKKSKQESDMDKDCDEALNQIVSRKYADGLDDYAPILLCGVAFYKKRVKIKLRRLV